ncbi:hypothetical protein [Limosilactobacillus equigenerosi]|uniref:Uncharacterized protein n=1 Tax=Limosilactobacillus equigenerosi DSM 18793 = JCM 14505 TaxID=1423742 RepID=A0A0R1UPB5_9LACO|nr:hypothetical protein [Limosilactobacillus equigenerosi]KRL95046.1 hypothetical protein FC21_GL001093 [Limosilactobacillus equigenerosi DSM 18793 = JCM 14505]
MTQEEVINNWRQLADWQVETKTGQVEPFSEMRLRLTMNYLHLQAEAAFLIQQIEDVIVRLSLHRVSEIREVVWQVLKTHGFTAEAAVYANH